MVEYDKITDEDKKALDISHVSDSALDFKSKNSAIEFYKYDDGDLEIDIKGEIFYLSEKQLKFFKDWI